MPDYTVRVRYDESTNAFEARAVDQGSGVTFSALAGTRPAAFLALEDRVAGKRQLDNAAKYGLTTDFLFDLEVRRDDPAPEAVPLVVLYGEPKAGERLRRLEETLVELLQAGARFIILDMTCFGKGDLQKEALRVLIAAGQRARKKGGALVLVGVPDHVAMALAMTCNDKFFLHSSSAEAALRGLAALANQPAELIAAQLPELPPDEDSAALMPSTLGSQDVPPVSEEHSGPVKCPECGTPLVIAPRNGSNYVVGYGALGSEGCCWYSRGLTAKR
jgi:hypothetical protein